MDATTFADKLASLAPGLESYISDGLTEDEARSLMRRYCCIRRPKPIVDLDDSNPVLELLIKWDLSNVGIGIVGFSDVPAVEDSGIVIGRVEADPLVIMRNTSEIVVLESGTEEHLLWPVAQNGEKMLDALIISAQFISSCSSGAIDNDDKDAAKFAAHECAIAAGGNKYQDFYYMLLGVE
jgi:hypothetical protein